MIRVLIASTAASAVTAATLVLVSMSTVSARSPKRELPAAPAGGTDEASRLAQRVTQVELIVNELVRQRAQTAEAPPPGQTTAQADSAAPDAPEAQMARSDVSPSQQVRDDRAGEEERFRQSSGSTAWGREREQLARAMITRQGSFASRECRGDFCRLEAHLPDSRAADEFQADIEFAPVLAKASVRVFAEGEGGSDLVIFLEPAPSSP